MDVPPELTALIRSWGVPGALVLVGLFVWFRWKDVVEVPGVRPALRLLRRHMIPQARGSTFAIGVCHLDGDEDQRLERLLVAGLADLPGVEVLRFDRDLELDGERPGENVLQGHERARRLLERSRADVMIWGEVLQADGRSIPKLYWTSAAFADRERVPGHYPLPENLTLPTVFSSDLADILRLLVVGYGQFFESHQPYESVNLTTFIDKVRKLKESAAAGWSTENRLKIVDVLASSLLRWGVQTGQREYLEEAVALRNEILNSTPESEHAQWGRAQHELGVALLWCGAHERGSTSLNQALACLSAALRVRPRTETPAEWATTQWNVGRTILNLAEHSGDPAQYLEAVRTFRDALEEISRDLAPVKWAKVQLDVGIAFYLNGMWTQSKEAFSEAESAIEKVLSTISRDRAPWLWASAQSGLAAILVSTGHLDGDQERVDRAISTVRAALQVLPRDALSLEWSNALHTLGTALLVKGDNTRDLPALCEAADTLRVVLEVRTAERLPVQWSATQMAYASTLNALGRYLPSPSKLVDAAEAVQPLLSVISRDEYPMRWAAVQYAHGSLLADSADDEPAKLERAADAFRDSLKVFTRRAAPLAWARSTMELGHVLRRSGQLLGDPERLVFAISAFRDAQGDGSTDQIWARAKKGEAMATLALAEVTQSDQRLDEAVATLQDAIAVNSPLAGFQTWLELQSCLGRALTRLGQRKNDLRYLERAKEVFLEALHFSLPEDFRVEWQDVEAGLEEAERATERVRSVAGGRDRLVH